MLRVASGIPGLDRVIDGGLPERSVTLVYGPPKSGKSMCAHQFLTKALDSGEACIYITLDYTANDLFDSMSILGFDLSLDPKRAALRVLDASSPITMHGQVKGLMGWLRGPKSLASPQNPNHLASAIQPMMHALQQSGSEFRTVLDSLTPLFIYNPPVISARFIQEYKGMIRQSTCSAGLVTYSEGAMDSQTETILKASVDNVIHLSDGMLSVEGMVGTPKIQAKYRITKNGVELEAS
jgi:KaiC/GvpD/RAD55 family RecA-like ATPase